jgi:recombination protein RecA
MKKKVVSNKFTEDMITSGVISKYGDVVRSGTEVLENINSLEVIGLSPALDIALGGGLREGSVVVMTGDPKSGKTTTALHFAAKCQAQNKKVIYVNTEGRLSKQNFEGIKGLNADKILIVESTNDRILTAEDFLNITEYYINNDPGCLIITDSLSNMVPACELEGEVRTGVRNALPRLLSMFFKRTSGTLMKNKTILICITHNIANTGGSPYAPSKMADCGNMLQFQAGTNMVITHRGKWQVPKDTGPHVGQIANWSIKTSNAGGRPNSTAESWIRYGIGIDETQEIVQIACEFRLIKSSGAWYTIACATENAEDPIVKEILQKNNVNNTPEDIEKFFKFQGANNVLEFLNNNETISNFIYQKIKELL